MKEAEWRRALPRLRERLGDRNFATWIEPIRCVGDDDGLRLEVPSRFIQEWVSRHLIAAIRDVLGPEASEGLRVVVADQSTWVAPAVVRESPPAPAVASRSRVPRVGRLVPDYIFDRFVVGPSNRVAFEAAKSIVVSPGVHYNPLFVWGGVGLGKTHLVNAIGHQILQENPRARVACIGAETFMNAMIGSLRQDQMAGFRDRYRELDVLILDDVQFLAGKERTQEEFFHTFECLYTAGKQVILTSDKPPSAMAGLENRLRSRFEGGLLADVRPPTAEMRLEIIHRKATLQGTSIQDDVALAIVQRCGPSVRELEGALTRVLASANLEAAPVTVDLVQQVLMLVMPRRKTLTIEAVQQRVAQHFGLSVPDLTSHRRGRAVSFPRQVAMYLSRTLADAALTAIAAKFGGRDHTTVLYAVKTVEAKAEKDPSTRHLIDDLQRSLTAADE